MSTHSVAQARDQFSNLIDRAIRGEHVVITRHGQPVVELKAVGQQARPMTAEDIEWLRERRVTLAAPDRDPRNFVQRMRDEDDERLLRR